VTGLVAGVPLRVGAWTLVPVSRVWLQAHADRKRPWAAGGAEPVAVVVRGGADTRALDVGGGTVDLEALLADVDGLAAALANDNTGEEP
jgi:hypothetical protein